MGVARFCASVKGGRWEGDRRKERASKEKQKKVEEVAGREGEE